MNKKNLALIYAALFASTLFASETDSLMGRIEYSFTTCGVDLCNNKYDLNQNYILKTGRYKLPNTKRRTKFRYISKKIEDPKGEKESEINIEVPWQNVSNLNKFFEVQKMIAMKGHSISIALSFSKLNLLTLRSGQKYWRIRSICVKSEDKKIYFKDIHEFIEFYEEQLISEHEINLPPSE